MEKKNEKKTSETFGSYALKSLPLHPLLKTKAARVDILLSRNGAWFFFLFLFASLSTRETTRKEKREKKRKKNFRKYLEDILKSSYLCIRFLKRTAIVKQAIFEQIYINNTSSTRAGASQINNWKLMIKARRTWVKQKNRQYLFYIDR